MEPLSRITAATVDVLIALLNHSESTWGLSIIKESSRPAGSVYPILERLETSGWVTSRWEDNSDRPGPRRRYYELSTDGATAAREVVKNFTARTTIAPRPVTP